MADTTLPIPSPDHPVVDRYRKWDPIWYRFLKPLWQNVKDTNVVITAVGNNYGVEVNVDGHVTAAIKLDGSPAESSFTVVADTFQVANPSDGGDVKSVFIVGNVDGASTVGINGDLIVDGTIAARALEVDTLSAISADIGEVTAGVIRSDDSKFIIDLNNKTITITT